MMKKEFDGRKLDHKTREQIRIRAVKLVKAGNSPEKVVKALGFHRSAIYQWLAAYHQGGINALKTKPITGRPSKLKGSQIKKLYDIITSKNPLQLKFEFALWTRDMVRDLIKDQFGVQMNVTSVGRLLKKLGFTVQRPLYRAYQKNPEQVDKWLSEEYPKIKKLAKKHRATIFFGDEAAVRSDYHKGTTWAPKGQTPIVESTGARFSVNMLSAISARGHLRFMTIKGRMNSDRFIEFLKRLIHNAKNPVFLIVDGHPTHRSGKVKRYVDSTKGRLHLFYLPPYSPELNPDELVWNYVKKHRMGRKAVKGPDHLREMVLCCLRALQKSPSLIKNFFKAPDVRYVTNAKT
jgi:transposase